MIKERIERHRGKPSHTDSTGTEVQKKSDEQAPIAPSAKSNKVQRNKEEPSVKIGMINSGVEHFPDANQFAVVGLLLGQITSIITRKRRN